MSSVYHRVNTGLLIIVALIGVTIIAMLATGVRGGPLDPVDPPGETDGVSSPGTPISAPTVINAPGHYYLTRNITIPAAGTAVEIESSNVTVDLGGFTIQGDPGSDDVGINVGVNEQVRILNGTIVDAEVGIDAGSSADIHISRVSVYGASEAFTLGAGAVLEDCAASGGGVGVSINQNRVTVRSCLIAFNDGSGIQVNGADFALIERSVIKQNNGNNVNDSGGIRVYVNSIDTTVRENDFSGNGVNDIFIDGAGTLIVDNMTACGTSFTLGISAVNTFAPVNTSDPHTNRTHKTAC